MQNKGGKKNYTKGIIGQTENRKMVDLSPNVIITRNVNGINTSNEKAETVR